jgi:hypothetical protein
MNKLTKKQIFEAGRAADDIGSLEAAKDRCRAFTVDFEFGSFRCDRIAVPVPVEPILKELNARISAAHAVLAAMGIELIPGDGASHE